MKPFTYLAERSEATPGLWNVPFSALSASIASLEAGTSIVSLNISSLSAAGIVTINANSTITDYLVFNDISNTRSDYMLGSHTPALGDGLSLYDLSGATTIVTFSKQSTRFYVPITGPVFDTGGQSINVKAYGAIGNGVIDDTGAVQLAIDSITSKGGTVFFPGGIYLVGGISITTHNTTLIGEGVGVSTLSLKASSNTATIRNSPGVRNIRITQLSINGNRGGQSSAPLDGGNGISINNAERVYIDNTQCFNTYTDGIRVKNGTFIFITNSHLTLNGAVGVNANGIDITGDSGDTGSTDILIQGNLVQANQGTGNGIFISSAPASGAGPGPFDHKRVSIIGNVIVDPYDIGIELKQCQEFTVTGNIISGSTSSLIRQTAGIYIRQSSFGVVSANHLSHCQDGITVDTNNYDNCFGVAITGNSVLSCSKNTASGAGIKVSAKSSLSCDNISITGNVVDRSGKNGIQIGATSGGRCTGITVTSNVISRASFTGVFIDTLCRDLSIAGNVTTNNGENGTDGGFAAGIAVTGTSGNILITDNRCFDDQTVKQQNYGVNIDSAVSNVLIANNLLYGNSSGAIRNASSGGSIVYGINLGF